MSCRTRPVEIVDITDADNHTTTVYFHQITKLPVRQVFYRRNAVTKDKDEEITLFSKYREVDGIQWPFAIERERNGEKSLRDIRGLREDQRSQSAGRPVRTAVRHQAAETGVAVFGSHPVRIPARAADRWSPAILDWRCAP